MDGILYQVLQLQLSKLQPRAKASNYRLNRCITTGVRLKREDETNCDYSLKQTRPFYQGIEGKQPS